MAQLKRRRKAALATMVGVGALTCGALVGVLPAAATPDEVGPIFVDGQAQVVPEFSDPSQWIRQQLWVETEFDSDGDGELDRMHVDVTRPAQTEDGLKVSRPAKSTPGSRAASPSCTRTPSAPACRRAAQRSAGSTSRWRRRRSSIG